MIIHELLAIRLLAVLSLYLFPFYMSCRRLHEYSQVYSIKLYVVLQFIDLMLYYLGVPNMRP